MPESPFSGMREILKTDVDLLTWPRFDFHRTPSRRQLAVAVEITGYVANGRGSGRSAHETITALTRHQTQDYVREIMRGGGGWWWWC